MALRLHMLRFYGITVHAWHGDHLPWRSRCASAHKAFMHVWSLCMPAVCLPHSRPP